MIKDKFNFYNTKIFLIHQFTPHAHNQIIYLIVFILVQQIIPSMTFLILINFA